MLYIGVLQLKFKRLRIFAFLIIDSRIAFISSHALNSVGISF